MAWELEGQMSLPIDSKWLIERQGAPDHVIRVIASDSPEFTAVYDDLPDNGSEFTGEVRTRQQTMISLRQRDDTVGYYAFHIGSRQGEQNEYLGSWGDVANGHSGRFRLLRQP
ncbi:MAG: hypothetical protein ACJ73S_00705 [Mycobacteriales bacterium]